MFSDSLSSNTASCSYALDACSHHGAILTYLAKGLACAAELSVTITGVFFSFFLFLLLGLLFSQKGLSYGSDILHGALNHTKNRILGTPMQWGISRDGELLNKYS